MMYWVKTPRWLKTLYPRDLVWEGANSDEPVVYITFDDGPHPTATPFALDQLDRYGAKATFFCVGNNIKQHPGVYAEILKRGHTTGNHTFDHVSGWKTGSGHYLQNIALADQLIHSSLFRPPYGRIKYSQVRKIRRQYPDMKIVMWDILSGDFDRDTSPQQCAENVIGHIAPGSIVIFHDSTKAWDRMTHALPLVLEHCSRSGWKMKALQ